MKRILFLLFFFNGVVFAQTDTTLLLLPERLDFEDVLQREPIESDQILSTPTRSVERAFDLPVTTWVIHSNDILRNGYVTLVDVLKAAPGIRVSQPGNAHEGETFLMRGMTGNQYVKIMINGVPVRSFVAHGMSIGAQLPVRQAERIEVVYGPMSSLYDDDACAGVVNIILKESERPVFMQADLSAGTLFHNNLDLFFGGKLFTDKNILRFSIYGSSTVRNRTDLFQIDSLYNMDRYVPADFDQRMYLYTSNYEPRNPEDSSYPLLSPIGHESRLFGVNLNWRGLRFTYQRMARSDAQQLGLNPLAVSYSTSDRIHEVEDWFMAGFHVGNRKVQFINNISAVRYTVDPNSSVTYINDLLTLGAFRAWQPIPQGDSLRNELRYQAYQNLSDGQRYMRAFSFDGRFDSRLNFRVSKQLSFDAGLKLGFGGGYPNFSRFAETYEDRTDIPFSPELNILVNINSQAVWNTKHWMVLANWSGHLGLVQSGPTSAKRLAATWKVDGNWRVFGQYAEGFRQPSAYAAYNNYLLEFDTITLSVVKRPSSFFTHYEKSRSCEAGMRFKRPNSEYELTGFWQTTSNLIRAGRLTAINDSTNGFTHQFGYRQYPGQSQSLMGVQARMSFNGASDFNFNFIGYSKHIVSRSRTEIYVQFCRGEENIPETSDAKTMILNQPMWVTQLRHTRTSGKFQYTITFNYQTEAASKSALYQPVWQARQRVETYPAFRTVDLMLRFYLNKNFVMYNHYLNLFNRAAWGLDATGSPDDLLMPIQPGRMVRFGVQYNMN